MSKIDGSRSDIDGGVGFASAPRAGVKHLWEYDHPYYCGEATWYRRSDGGSDHTRWDSWADFNESTIFVSGDRDLNLLARWDWHSWQRHPDPDLRSDSPDELCLYFVMQRKGYLCSHYIRVTDDDEPAVRAFLEECAATTVALWEPFLGQPKAVGTAGGGQPNTSDLPKD